MIQTMMIILAAAAATNAWERCHRRRLWDFTNDDDLHMQGNATDNVMTME